MAITYVGAGAVATGNNASVVPGLPAGLADADLMILVASIRNSGVGTVNDVTGWTRIAGSNNLAVFGRLRLPGDAAPTVSFTGGVANADTIAQVFALRGAELSVGSVYFAGGVNASAQDIAYPALNITGPGQAALIVAWKQDDATAYSTPAGFTALALGSTTTGDDASQRVYYQIQTTETDIAAGTITVTGGAAAISRAITLGVRQRGSLAAVQQDSWPPRIAVTLDGIAAGDAFSIYRVRAGQETLVRAGSGTAVDSAVVRVDAEIPFGVPFSYKAYVNSQVSYATGTATVALPGGLNAVTDAVAGTAAEVIVQEWTSKRRDRRSSVFRTSAGRTVVVSGPVGQPQSTVTLFTTTEVGADDLVEVLENATQGVVQIRQGTGATGIDAYLSVLGFEEERYDPTQGEDVKRLWRLEVAETDPWGAALSAAGFTFQDVLDAYTGLTFANLLADHPTFLSVLQGDYS